MYIRKKMRTRIILIVIVVLGFLYWRGSKAYIKEQGLDCKYHIAYAFCKGKQPTKIPGIFEIFKAGTKF